MDAVLPGRGALIKKIFKKDAWFDAKPYSIDPTENPSLAHDRALCVGSGIEILDSRALLRMTAEREVRSVSTGARMF